MERKYIPGTTRQPTTVTFTIDSSADSTETAILLGDRGATISMEFSSQGGTHVGNLAWELCDSGADGSFEAHADSPYAVAAGAFIQNYDNLLTTKRYFRLVYNRTNGSGTITAIVHVTYND